MHEIYHTKRIDMVISSKSKGIITECLSFVFILLFVYSAVNKVLEFDKFQVQLAQSPLLTAYTGWVSYAVPISEILISVGLGIPKIRLGAQYGFLVLMVMFTAYIAIILNFSPYVPCACGGIIDELDWGGHLVFNVCFVLLGVGAILMGPYSGTIPKATQRKARILGVLIVSVISVAVVSVLFIMSEDVVHKRNNFTRRFPQHPAVQGKELDLGSNNYYIAGVDSDFIYLGNTKAATTVTLVSRDFKRMQTRLITVPDPERKFKSLTVVVRSPWFYLYDGGSAFVYTGFVNDWKAKLWSADKAYFNHFEPVDSLQAIVRTVSSASNEVVLGRFYKNGDRPLHLCPDVLTKQIDGVFDVDGSLMYNRQVNKIIYVYAYRNEYLIMDTDLKNKVSGHTIDTTSRAQIKVRYVPSLNASKLATPDKVVNRLAATFGRYLYVNSKLIGKFEPTEMWDQASIVDVYDVEKQRYVLSFYLYDEDGEKISDFEVTEDYIYVVAGKYLVPYQIEKIAFERNTMP